MFLLVMMSVLQVRAQDVSKMMESARAFSQKGDFANALLVLNKANKTKPGDLEIQKELGLHLL
jgi:Flp pilus assembly protein TadD